MANTRRSFTKDEVVAMFGPKPWHETEAMLEMQQGYLEELPERWPSAENPDQCAIAFLDGMRMFRAAIAEYMLVPREQINIPPSPPPPPASDAAIDEWHERMGGSSSHGG